jgi:hypothetical protein
LFAELVEDLDSAAFACGAPFKTNMAITEIVIMQVIRMFFFILYLSHVGFSLDSSK